MKKLKFEENQKREKIINSAKDFLKEILPEDINHDINHSLRTFQLSLDICESESKADVFIVSLTSLLHDVDNKTIFPDNESLQNVNLFFIDNEIDNSIKEKINQNIIEINEKKIPSSIEGKIVQDACNLDKIGAIGIAKNFIFGGLNNNKIYDSEEKFEENNNSNNEDNNNESNNNDNNNKVNYDNISSIGYFYKKLFFLRHKINTKKGKEIAEERYKFMLNFLKEFYKDILNEDKIEEIELMEKNIDKEKIEEYSKKINEELLKMIYNEKEKEERREKIKESLENQIEKKNIEDVFKIERGQAVERIKLKKEQCDHKINQYIKDLNKQREEREKKVEKENLLLTQGKY